MGGHRKFCLLVADNLTYTHNEPVCKRELAELILGLPVKGSNSSSPALSCGPSGIVGIKSPVDVAHDSNLLNVGGYMGLAGLATSDF